jgi:hypothetical protein
MRSQNLPKLRPYKHTFCVGQSDAIRTDVLKAVGDLIETLDVDVQHYAADILLLSYRPKPCFILNKTCRATTIFR